MTSSVASSSSPSSSLLGDLTGTTNAIQRGHWLAPGMSADGPISALGNVSNPLSAIVEAGFSFIMPLIDFLEIPLQLLGGDPGSIMSSAQNLGGAGQSVSSLANDYQQAAGAQTTSWSGPAADGYQNTSVDQSTGNAALGQASSGLSSAVTGSGGAVAQTLFQVLQLLANAATAIISILVPAINQSPNTWGASLAGGISSSVGVAGGAGALIAGKMGMLLDSAQNLNGLVQQLESAVSNAEQVITQFTQSSGNTTPATGSTSA